LLCFEQGQLGVDTGRDVGVQAQFFQALRDGAGDQRRGQVGVGA